MNKSKLRKVLNKLNGLDDKTAEAFKNFQTAATKLQTTLKETIQDITLEQVDSKLSDFQKKIDFQPVLDSFNEFKKALSDEIAEHRNQIDKNVEKVRDELSETRGTHKDNITDLDDKLLEVEDKVSALEKKKMPDFMPQIKDTERRLTDLIERTKKTIQENDDKSDQVMKDEIEKEIKELNQLIIRLRSDMQSRGGGSMNRQILINGVDPLTKYTDINLKPGSNVTITYQNNTQTKKVDVTISATGGGGGGITRSINSVSTSQSAGSASGTDYVYLCSGTMTLMLPDATAGNSNLYTVKNVGTGVITITTVSAQTIDGNPTIQMATQYTSVDLISNTANWDIT